MPTMSRFTRAVSFRASLAFISSGHLLHSLSSTMIHGVARDAQRVADAIAVRVQAPSFVAAAGAERPRPAAMVAGADGFGGRHAQPIPRATVA